MGLRKFKSEKDLRGKLRKARTSDEGARTHQRLPSIPPVLPIPSHITVPRSSASTFSSTSSGSTIQPPAYSSATGSTQRKAAARAQHRRSRSFSTLTTLLSPGISAEQPWRSREAWLAIHSRSPSPPPTTPLPSAPGGADGGWRRKGNGGFFARELGGVGDTALGFGTHGFVPLRPGLSASGRSRTMCDLAAELERPIPSRQNSEPVATPMPAVAPHDSGAEWKPGFATSLFRQKTQAVLRAQPLSPSDQEIINTPPPSRPESRILPDSGSPPVPPLRTRNTATRPSIHRDTVTTASTCSVTPSDRTSQSSSIHTVEQSELYHVTEVDKSCGYESAVDVDTKLSRRVNDMSLEDTHLLRPNPSDVPTSPAASPLLPHDDRLPDPTSTYYHFGSVHSVGGRPVSNASHRSKGSRRDQGEENRPLPSTRHTAQVSAGEDGSQKAEKVHGWVNPDVQGQARTQRTALPVRHTRDESLPPLLPLSAGDTRRPIPHLTDPNASRMRMRDMPWARAQAATSNLAERPQQQAAPHRSMHGDDKLISRKSMRSIREAERDVPPLPSPGVRERWSKVYERQRRESESASGSGSTDGHRGGWI